MIKIAIPLFGTRVSPRFDYTQGFLLVEEENGEIIERQEISAEDLTPYTRVRKLSELGIDTLICGGIDRASTQQLSFNGIRIYSWVTGEAEDALRCFLEGRLETGVMIGAGGHRCGRWRFKGGDVHRVSGQRGRGKGRVHGSGWGRGQGRG